MKSLIFLFIKLIKLAKFGKIFLSIISIFASLGTYAVLYGWQFGVGIVALIFIHEMGHYIAARQKNLDVGLPTFIPFVGAFIVMKEHPVNAEIEAYVAYAGPFIGTLAAFIFYFWGQHTGSGLAIALARVGFIINLFNLIPLNPLDGGRITAIISPRVWFLGVPILIGVWIYSYSPMLILIAILALPQLQKAWYFDPKSPENKAYYDINNSTRFEYAFLYILLAVVLALMIGNK